MQHLHERSTPDASIPGPSPSATRILRAGDDDRRRVADLLQAHFVSGRLTSTELEERIERALSAKTLADLDALLADLPRIEPTPRAASAPPGQAHWSGHRGRFGQAPRSGEKPFRAHATSYLLVMALLVTIWLLTTPGGYFWPVWPMLGWGIGLASHGLAARGLGGRHGALSHR